MNTIKGILPSANFHLWKSCNMNCTYCFARYDDLPSGAKPSRQNQILTIKALAKAGVEKLTFVGGEPTLCPWLQDLIMYGKKLGMVTMLVTNGALLDAVMLRDLRSVLDWVCLSIDSLSPATNALIGRQVKGRAPMEEGDYRRILSYASDMDYRIKVNTVVSTYNRNEDFRAFIEDVCPDRWKIFKALPIQGQNYITLEQWNVSDNDFQSFVRMHKSTKGVSVISEDNDAMTGSYMMIDPLCRLFDNVDGRQSYTRPINAVGLHEALREVRIDTAGFISRGGLYDWSARQKEEVACPA